MSSTKPQWKWSCRWVIFHKSEIITVLFEESQDLSTILIHKCIWPPKDFFHSENEAHTFWALPQALLLYIPFLLQCDSFYNFQTSFQLQVLQRDCYLERIKNGKHSCPSCLKPLSHNTSLKSQHQGLHWLSERCGNVAGRPTEHGFFYDQLLWRLYCRDRFSGYLRSPLNSKINCTDSKRYTHCWKNTKYIIKHNNKTTF